MNLGHDESLPQVEALDAERAESPDDVQQAPLRSTHTANFPELLDQIGCSLLVTTYQAQKLLMVRSDGGRLNTHFRDFLSPMGLALEGDRLAIGTLRQIMEFHNIPAVAGNLDPAGRYDACFLPRSTHATGNIQVHEMAWGRDELYFVNTRFSCICVLDRIHSFVPWWKPAFISGLAPEDRCHLNGLTMKDGQPKFVTALAATDSPAGWRENKAHTGIVIDIPSGEVVSTGLSMPHSPRWHNGRLWVCDSGTGSLGTIDLGTGKYEPIAFLPGFTRGLDILGNLAFVGLSQVRETAIFSGIPIADQRESLRSGVWVVNLDSGQTIAFLQFEDALQEIFAVTVMRRFRFPELINDDPERLNNSFVLPDQALTAVPQQFRFSSPDRMQELAGTAPISS